MKKVLEIGSGIDYYKPQEDEEVVHTDIQGFLHVEQIMDINKRFPFEDDTFDKVLCSHILEHAKDLVFTMGEIYRVCRPNAIIQIIVPFWASRMAHSEHHTRFFRHISFQDYQGDSSFGATGVRLKKISARYVYSRGRFRILKIILEKLSNKYPEQEDLWASLPIKPIELHFKLLVEK